MSRKLIVYGIVVLLGFAVFVPVPFAPAEIQRFLSGSPVGVALPIISLFLLTAFGIGLLITSLRNRWTSKYVVLEAIGVPVLFICVRLLMHEPLTELRYMTTAWLNKGKPVEEFVNPFLGLFMMDCSEVSKRIEVVFIPEHLAPDTDYLEYRPDRDFVYESGPIERFYGDDWYKVGAASQWYGSSLGNCAVKHGLISY